MALLVLPLRTLDALHLATAVAIGANAVATANDTFAAAAAGLHLRVEWFGKAERTRQR